MNDRGRDPALRLESVDVVYHSGIRRRNRFQALRDITLSLEPGVVTGLVGVNGAGKTTMIEVMVGALEPSDGGIEWFGQNEWDTEVRRRVGFCADIPCFPPFLTSREVLRLYCGLKGIPGETVEDVVEASIARLALGDLGDRRVSKLSRGNVLRLGLAQALLGQPDLLILDESFAPLDPRAQRQLRSILREEGDRGAAVLISSHQLDQVQRVADEILLLDHGVLVRRMDREELEELAGDESLEEVLFNLINPAHEPPRGDTRG